MQKQIIFLWIFFYPFLCFPQSNGTARSEIVKTDTIHCPQVSFRVEWIMITGAKDNLHDYMISKDTLYDCEISILELDRLTHRKYKAILYGTYLKSGKKWLTYLPCLADSNSAFSTTLIPVEKIGSVKIKRSGKCE